jgi:hypothetical protein
MAHHDGGKMSPRFVPFENGLYIDPSRIVGVTTGKFDQISQEWWAALITDRGDRIELQETRFYEAVEKLNVLHGESA